MSKLIQEVTQTVLSRTADTTEYEFRDEPVKYEYDNGEETYYGDFADYHKNDKTPK